MRRSAIVAVSLLAVYLTVAGWLFHGQATAWPHQGSWAEVVLIFVGPGMLFQAVNLAFLWRFQRRPARRWLIRLFTVPAGLLLGVALSAWASGRARAGFTEAYQPFVAQVGAHLADSCGRAAELFAIPSVAAYNAQTGWDHPVAKLSHDGQRFVLGFGGGSIDIDGSTMYYDSRVQQWRTFHNDTPPAAYTEATAGLAECSLRVAGP
jgi:hypothetical protein